ncbi:MAG: type II toxin-antitoxin system RelE/ParE family toxin [Rhodobacteraceae bacterium]|nr:type II toxin-antitoxin system RelE/ParE family toxin [Paracoccaceae bacterium]
MNKNQLSFRHRGIKRFYEKNDPRGVPADQAKRIRRGLSALEAANKVSDLHAVPGWQLHPLNGIFEEYWSIRINRNWRLIFRFENNRAFDLDLVDYH